jgi:protein-L-isoaspartate(D-aspartate) O-methyltransferase
LNSRARATRDVRRRMVVRQLMARGLTDRRVLAAMAAVPREHFVPPALRSAAYDDAPLPVGERQTISQPYIVALMTACLAPRRTHRVLEIGTGSGYQTAVLSRLVSLVYTIERLPLLAAAARARLLDLGIVNVEWHIGDGTLGWAEQAPFDGIMVTAATPTLPPQLVAQLGNGGRIVAPVGDLALQELVVGFKSAAGLETRRAGPCRFVPLIGRDAFAEWS